MAKKLILQGLMATIVCFLLLGTFLYTSNSEATEATKSMRSAFVTYDNLDLGIKMQYPSSWKIAEEGYDSVSFDSPNVGIAFNIQVIEFPGNIPEKSEKVFVSGWANKFISSQEKSKPEYSVIDRTPTTFAGNPAYKVVYTDHTYEEGKEFKIKGMDTVMVDGKKFYHFMYFSISNSLSNSVETYSKYLPTVNRMLNSVQIMH